MPVPAAKRKTEKITMTSRPIAVLFAVFLTMPPLALAASDAVFPPGSHIGLTPPPGMVAAESFPGFEDRERKAAILISQVPGQAYEQFLKSMNSGAINIPGVSNAKREILLTEAGAAHLVIGDQEADGVKFRKWLMITRRTVASHETDSTVAFIVTAQVPVEAGTAYPDDAIRKALGTVAVRAKVPPQEILERLPFRVTELANFEGVRSLVPGRAIMLTDASAGSEPQGEHPFLMISIGAGAPSQADERATFAQNILRNIQGYKNLRPVFSEPVRVGGQPGYEIRLEGQSLTNETDVVIVQWMRFGGGNFIRLVGVSPKQDWSESFGRFRAVRDGIDTR